MAEALYTITTLAQTSSSVVMNSTLSDLSFLATTVSGTPTPRLRVDLETGVDPASPTGPFASARNTQCLGADPQVRRRAPATVISRRVGWDTDLADRGSLRSQRQAPNRAAPTDDCHLSRRPRGPRYCLPFNRSTAALNTSPRSA